MKFCLSRSDLYLNNPNLTKIVSSEVNIHQYINKHKLQDKIFINFSNLKINNLETLILLENIQYLYLNYNEIENIQGIKNCKRLKVLDISHNYIKSLDYL